MDKSEEGAMASVDFSNTPVVSNGQFGEHATESLSSSMVEVATEIDEIFNDDGLFASFGGFELAAKDEAVTQKVDIGTQKVDIGTQKVNVGTQNVDIGTQKVDIGTQKVNIGTQNIDIAIEVQEHEKSTIELVTSCLKNTQFVKMSTFVLPDRTAGVSEIKPLRELSPHECVKAKDANKLATLVGDHLAVDRNCGLRNGETIKLKGPDGKEKEYIVYHLNDEQRQLLENALEQLVKSSESKSEKASEKARFLKPEEHPKITVTVQILPTRVEESKRDEVAKKVQDDAVQKRDELQANERALDESHLLMKRTQEKIEQIGMKQVIQEIKDIHSRDVTMDTLKRNVQMRPLNIGQAR